MKRLLFALLLFLSISSFAQEQNKISKPSLPVQAFRGYIIKLNSTSEAGYGFDILYQGKAVISQKLNPFTLSPKGLSTHENAFKVARWQVQQIASGMPSSIISGQPLPFALAKQLNISLE